MELKSHNRFKDAEWYNQKNTKITIGGAGGIGSWLILFLSRIGFKMNLYEMDTIDYTNMAGQLYPTNSIGEKKAEVIKKLIKEFSDHDKIEIYEKYEKDYPVTPIVFTAFDNMEARKNMFETWCKLKDREIFIDGRMLIESGQIHVALKGTEKEYRKTLFEDKEAEKQPCSLKATSHSGAFIASLMTTFLTNYIVNKKRKMDFRVLPRMLIYELQLMDFHLKIDNYDYS